MKTIIKASTIVLKNKIIENGSVSVDKGRIVGINETDRIVETIDLGNLTLMPGLIDIHVHGGYGADTMDADYEALNKISKFKINEGVTSFIPTTVTAPIEAVKKAVMCVRDTMKTGVDGAKILGSFAEGPYISEMYNGAHSPEYIKEIDINEIEELIELGEGTLKSMLIAPEKEHALDAIRLLTERGVRACLGHTNADYDEFTKGIEAGALVGVHTYNAMSPLLHRKPGAVGSMMNNDGIYAEVICDLIHVDSAAIQVLVRCKGYDNIVLVTDCMRAGGLPDGYYTLGAVDVAVRNGIATTREHSLAGSTISLNRALKNYNMAVSVPLVDAVRAATYTPAQIHGLEKEIGSIEIGLAADLIAMDSGFNVKFVMVDGIQKK